MRMTLLRIIHDEGVQQSVKLLQSSRTGIRMEMCLTNCDQIFVV